MTPAMPIPDLAARTLELVDIPSESRREAALRSSSSASLLPGRAALRRRRGARLRRRRGAGRPRRAPRHGAGAGQPPRPDRRRRRARPRRERHEGRRRGDARARARGARRLATSSSRARRCRSRRARCPRVFASGVLAGTELAVVLEPTDASSTPAASATSRRGSTSTARARTRRGRGRAERDPRARRGLAPLAALEPLDVELDGLVYREVLSVVRVEGGIAPNVVPALATAELNFRYAPGRSRDEAEARLRELVPARRARRSSSNSPSAPPALDEPARRAAARARPRRRAEAGVDAGRAVRRAGHRRDQLRPRRDGVRAQAGRADPDREPARGVRDARLGSSSVINPVLDARWRRIRSSRLEEARRRLARGRRRRDRLRQGRSERADRPDDPAGARRGAAGAGAVSARAGAAGAARGGRGLARAPLRRRGRSRHGDHPDVRLEGGDLLARAGARTPAGSVVAFGEPAYPGVRARRALRRRARCRRCRCARENGFLPDLDGARRRRRARLGQLPAQPDRRGRAARVLRASSRRRRSGTTSSSPPTRRTPSSGSTSRRRRRCRSPTARASSSSRR